MQRYRIGEGQNVIRMGEKRNFGICAFLDLVHDEIYVCYLTTKRCLTSHTSWNTQED
jgi:hypothetical protein